jgi:hypothetical protein
VLTLVMYLYTTDIDRYAKSDSYIKWPPSNHTFRPPSLTLLGRYLRSATFPYDAYFKGPLSPSLPRASTKPAFALYPPEGFSSNLRLSPETRHHASCARQQGREAIEKGQMLQLWA